MVAGTLGGCGEVLSSVWWQCRGWWGVEWSEVVLVGELLRSSRPLVVCKFHVEQYGRRRRQAVGGVWIGVGGVRHGVRLQRRCRGGLLWLKVAFQEEA